MTRLAGISGQEARKAFERDGWVFRRQRGSHMVMKKDGVRAMLSIPDHRELKVPLLKRFIRDAEIIEERFLELLGR